MGTCHAPACGAEHPAARGIGASLLHRRPLLSVLLLRIRFSACALRDPPAGFRHTCLPSCHLPPLRSPVASGRWPDTPLPAGPGPESSGGIAYPQRSPALPSPGGNRGPYQALPAADFPGTAVSTAASGVNMDRFGYLYRTLPYSPAASGASTVTGLVGHFPPSGPAASAAGLCVATNHFRRVFSPWETCIAPAADPCVWHSSIHAPRPAG